MPLLITGYWVSCGFTDAIISKSLRLLYFIHLQTANANNDNYLSLL